MDVGDLKSHNTRISTTLIYYLIFSFKTINKKFVVSVNLLGTLYQLYINAKCFFINF